MLVVKKIEYVTKNLSPTINQVINMNYYYDLPSEIINLIDDKVNDLYKKEHKEKFALTWNLIRNQGECYVEYVYDFLPLEGEIARESVVEFKNWYMSNGEIEISLKFGNIWSKIDWEDLENYFEM